MKMEYGETFVWYSHTKICRISADREFAVGVAVRRQTVPRQTTLQLQQYYSGENNLWRSFYWTFYLTITGDG
jgi:hypothetical protein